MKLTIAALLTCHNRRDRTSDCLRSLRNQLKPTSAAVQLNVFLVDDGCTDDTVGLALKIWPDITIITGDGNLFWCGGMRKAWATAASSDPDYYLLLNDDVVLFPEAVNHLLALCPRPESRTIAVGATCDPNTGEWTYGGLECEVPFRAKGLMARRCRTMNGNCVLVSRAVFMEMGMLREVYRHAMSDMDYGFAASRKGIALVETPRFVGECSRNPVCGTWRDNSLPRSIRFRLILSRKGLPPKEWFYYCWRNYGIHAPRYALSPYLRVLLGL